MRGASWGHLGQEGIQEGVIAVDQLQILDEFFSFMDTMAYLLVFDSIMVTDEEV
jgi:hypothetical protein